MFELAEAEAPPPAGDAAGSARQRGNGGEGEESSSSATAAEGSRRDGDHAGALPALQAVHHPFTAPCEEDAPVLLDAIRSFSNPSFSSWEFAEPLAVAAQSAAAVAPPPPEAWRRLLAVRAQHYDLVCNGVELGGGSVRLHEAATQRGVLETILRVTPRQLDGFAPLLAALGSGAPPHGGLALGLDRLVATLVGPDCAQSVRDVIAFPKSAMGNDVLVGAPAEATPQQWAELHLAPVRAGSREGA